VAHSEAQGRGDESAPREGMLQFRKKRGGIDRIDSWVGCDE